MECVIVRDLSGSYIIEDYTVHNVSQDCCDAISADFNTRLAGTPMPDELGDHRAYLSDAGDALGGFGELVCARDADCAMKSLEVYLAYEEDVLALTPRDATNTEDEEPPECPACVANFRQNGGCHVLLDLGYDPPYHGSIYLQDHEYESHLSDPSCMSHFASCDLRQMTNQYCGPPDTTRRLAGGRRLSLNGYYRNPFPLVGAWYQTCINNGSYDMNWVQAELHQEEHRQGCNVTYGGATISLEQAVPRCCTQAQELASEVEDLAVALAYEGMGDMLANGITCESEWTECAAAMRTTIDHIVTVRGDGLVQTDDWERTCQERYDVEFEWEPTDCVVQIRDLGEADEVLRYNESYHIGNSTVGCCEELNDLAENFVADHWDNLLMLSEMASHPNTCPTDAASRCAYHTVDLLEYLFDINTRVINDDEYLEDPEEGNEEGIDGARGSRNESFQMYGPVFGFVENCEEDGFNMTAIWNYITPHDDEEEGPVECQFGIEVGDHDFVVDLGTVPADCCGFLRSRGEDLTSAVGVGNFELWREGLPNAHQSVPFDTCSSNTTCAGATRDFYLLVDEHLLEEVRELDVSTVATDGPVSNTLTRYCNGSLEEPSLCYANARFGERAMILPAGEMSVSCCDEVNDFAESLWNRWRSVEHLFFFGHELAGNATCSAPCAESVNMFADALDDMVRNVTGYTQDISQSFVDHCREDGFDTSFADAQGAYGAAELVPCSVTNEADEVIYDAGTKRAICCGTLQPFVGSLLSGSSYFGPEYLDYLCPASLPIPTLEQYSCYGFAEAVLYELDEGAAADFVDVCESYYDNYPWTEDDGTAGPGADGPVSEVVIEGLSNEMCFTDCVTPGYDRVGENPALMDASSDYEFLCPGEGGLLLEQNTSVAAFTSDATELQSGFSMEITLVVQGFTSTETLRVEPLLEFARASEEDAVPVPSPFNLSSDARGADFVTLALVDGVPHLLVTGEGKGQVLSITPDVEPLGPLSGSSPRCVSCVRDFKENGGCAAADGPVDLEAYLGNTCVFLSTRCESFDLLLEHSCSSDGNGGSADGDDDDDGDNGVERATCSENEFCPKGEFCNGDDGPGVGFCESCEPFTSGEVQCDGDGLPESGVEECFATCVLRRRTSSMQGQRNPSSMAKEGCAVPDGLGDGQCNTGNNNNQCGWDGGDCCAETCHHPTCTQFFQSLDCLDPDVNSRSDEEGRPAPFTPTEVGEELQLVVTMGPFNNTDHRGNSEAGGFLTRIYADGVLVASEETEWDVASVQRQWKIGASTFFASDVANSGAIILPSRTVYHVAVWDRMLEASEVEHLSSRTTCLGEAAPTAAPTFAPTQAPTNFPTFAPTQPEETLAPTNPPDVDLESARFSDIGAEVIVLFTGPTDKAGIFDAEFPCSQIIDGGSTSILRGERCSWSDDRTLRMRMKRESVIVPSSAIGIAEDAVRAKCLNEDPKAPICGTYPSPAMSIVVEGPLETPQPQFQLEYKSLVSNCDASFTIDASGTYGNGGRPFTNVEWTYSSASQAQSAASNDHIVSAASLASEVNSPSLTIMINETGSHALTVGTDFTFALTVDNFLGGSATTNDIVVHLQDDTYPVARIDGAKVQYTTPDRVLYLVGGESASCGRQNITSRVWTEESGYLSAPHVSSSGALVSRSRRAQVLQLDPYTLEAGRTYTFAYTATNDQGRSSSLAVDVIVGSLGLTVDLLFCNKTISPTAFESGAEVPNVHVVDASFSFDQNAGPRETGVAAGLEISYTGRVSFIPGTFDTTCLDRSLPSGTGDTYSFGAEGYSGCRVELTVTVSKGVRAERQLCWLDVQDFVVPGIDASSELLTKVNAGDKTILRGRMFDSVVGDVEGTWMLVSGDLASGVSLDAAATTETYKLLPQIGAGDAEQYRRFDLVLSPLTLVEQAVYTFRLQAAFVESTVNANAYTTGSASVDVIIAVNGPPASGDFVVEPEVGTLLETLFDLRASGWVDEPSDLPLRYTFSVIGDRYDLGDEALVSSLGDIPASVLNPGSDKSTALEGALLPQGKETGNFTVTCGVRVTDTLGAVARRWRGVTVNPIPVDEAADSVNAALEDADPSDTDAVFQLLSVSAAVGTAVEDEDAAVEVQTASMDLLAQAAALQDPTPEAFESQSTVLAGILGGLEEGLGAGDDGGGDDDVPDDDAPDDDVPDDDAGSGGGDDDPDDPDDAEEAPQLSLAVATRALDLVGSIAESLAANSGRGTNLLSDATEKASLSTLSKLLDSAIADDPERVSSVQDSLTTMQKVRANTLTVGEEAVEVQIGNVDSKVAISESDGGTDARVGTDVLLDVAALAALNIAAGAQFMVSTAAYAPSLYADNTTRPYNASANAAAEQNSTARASTTMRFTVTVGNDSSLGDLAAETDSQHDISSELLTSLNLNASANHTFECTDTGGTLSHECPNGEVLTHVCTEAGSTEVRCRNSDFVCAVWNATLEAMVERADCTAAVVVGSSGPAVYCDCGTSTGRRRRLAGRSAPAPRFASKFQPISHADRHLRILQARGEDAEDVNFASQEGTETTSVDMATLFETWGTSYASTLTSVAELSVADVEGAWMSFSVIGGMLALIVLLAMAGSRLDERDKRAEEAEIFADPSAAFTPSFEPENTGANPTLWYGLLVLEPKELANHKGLSACEWMSEEIKDGHDVISTLMLRKSDTPRTLRVLSLAIMTFTVMMVDASIFQVLYPSGEEEHCAQFQDMGGGVCEEEGHPVNENSARCQYIEASGECLAVEIDVSLYTIILVSMFAVAISKPIDMFLESMIEAYLLSDILHHASSDEGREYHSTIAKMEQRREELYNDMYRKEMADLHERPGLRPAFYRIFPLNSCVGSSLKQRVRRSIDEAVDIQVRMEMEEDRIVQGGLAGSEAHRHAQRLRRLYLIQLGIRDAMPTFRRMFFSRFVDLAEGLRKPLWQKRLVGVLLVLYVLFCALWVVLFTIANERSTVTLWTIAFAVAQLEDIILIVPLKLILANGILPSLMRDKVHLSIVDELPHVSATSIWLRCAPNARVLVPGIDILIPRPLLGETDMFSNLRGWRGSAAKDSKDAVPIAALEASMAGVLSGSATSEVAVKAKEARLLEGGGQGGGDGFGPQGLKEAIAKGSDSRSRIDELLRLSDHESIERHEHSEKSLGHVQSALTRLNCFVRFIVRLFSCVFFVFMVLPEDVQDLLLQAGLPFCLGFLVLLDVPVDDESVEYALKAGAIMLFIVVMLFIIAVVEGAVARTVRRV